MADDSPWRCWVCDGEFGGETRFRQHVRHIHITGGYRPRPTQTMPRTDLGTDEAEQAFDLLGHRRYVDVMGGIETAVRHAAVEHGVALPDDAIDEIQQFFAEEIVDADERGSAFPDDLVEEMREPTEPPAQTSVGMAVGAKSSDHKALDELTRAGIAANHRR